MKYNETILDRFSDDDLRDILYFKTFVNVNKETIETELKRRLGSKIINKVLFEKFDGSTNIYKFNEDSYDVINIIHNSDDNLNHISIYLRTNLTNYNHLEHLNSYTETDTKTWNKYYNLYQTINELVDNMVSNRND